MTSTCRRSSGGVCCVSMPVVSLSIMWIPLGFIELFSSIFSPSFSSPPFSSCTKRFASNRRAISTNRQVSSSFFSFRCFLVLVRNHHTIPSNLFTIAVGIHDFHFPKLLEKFSCQDPIFRVDAILHLGTSTIPRISPASLNSARCCDTVAFTIEFLVYILK